MARSISPATSRPRPSMSRRTACSAPTISSGTTSCRFREERDAAERAMETNMVRVGLIGFGFIGVGLYRAITSHEIDGLEVAFVWNRSADKLAGVAAPLVLADLASFADAAPDLIIESAHPDITRAHGEAFLARCDYMPFSVTALADDGLHHRVIASAGAHGHRLIIPQGALVGTDALLGWRHMWRDVTITFRKHPNNID